MQKPAKDQRKTELAMIHMGKAQLCMDEDSYRAMLWTVARVRSAADLDWAGRQKVLDHMKAKGAIFKSRKGKPKHVESTSLMGKIGALLADMKLPWSYAHAIAKQMFGVQQLEWCNDKQLQDIVAALVKRQQKNAAG